MNDSPVFFIDGTNLFLTNFETFPE